MQTRIEKLWDKHQKDKSQIANNCQAPSINDRNGLRAAFGAWYLRLCVCLSSLRFWDLLFTARSVLACEDKVRNACCLNPLAECGLVRFRTFRYVFVRSRTIRYVSVRIGTFWYVLVRTAASRPLRGEHTRGLRLARSRTRRHGSVHCRQPSRGPGRFAAVTEMPLKSTAAPWKMTDSGSLALAAGRSGPHERQEKRFCTG